VNEEYDANAGDPAARGTPADDASPDTVPFDRPAPFPWPPAPDDSVSTAFGRTWQGASLAPGRFFERMPERGSLGAAVLYYLAIGIPVEGARLFWRMIGDARGADQEIAGTVDSALSMSPLLGFLLSPLFLLGTLLLATAVVHLMLKLVGGANRDIQFTARLFCFAYSPQILGVIPWIGAPIGFVWMIVSAIAGLKAGHRTTTGRAIVAVMIPVTIALAFVAMTLLLARAAGILPGLA
jgi:hypothetical protein